MFKGNSTRVDEFFEPKYKTASVVGGYRRFPEIHDFSSYFLKLQLKTSQFIIPKRLG
jgi:hypothetical protein